MQKPLFPIGKTQWAKWQMPARSAFNEERLNGATHEEAVRIANEVQRATHTLPRVEPETAPAKRTAKKGK